MGDTQVDGELLRQARTGSHAAFRALIEPTGTSCAGTAIG